MAGIFDYHLFGAIAGFLTTVCFVPQALKIIRTKHTEGVSLLMYALFSTGVFFWLVYGILLQSWPMIIANSVTLFLALLILISLIRAKKR